MAQIIKHRRGSIGSVKGTTTRNGEILIASGSISDLSGPFVFVGSPVASDEGVQGAFKPTSKIYTGNVAPTIAVGTYGSIMDGTPFYASSNESLYVLNNDGVGNERLDLTGNIEGNTISNVTITALTGSHANVTSITGNTLTVTGNETVAGTLGVTGNTALGGTLGVTGDTTIAGALSVTRDISTDGDIYGNNLQLSGNADIAGNINLGGNITVGDATTDFVKFGADVSSSIIPDVNNAFDLGSASKGWKDIHVAGTAYIDNLEARNINLDSVSVIDSLTVQGNTFIGDSVEDILEVAAGDILFRNVPAGDTTTFVGLNGENKLVQDELDSRVLGGTLVDNNGTPLTANRVPFAADGDSLIDDSNLTFDSINDVLNVATSRIGDNILVGNKLTTTGVSELKGAVGINSTLEVTGSATLKSNLEVEGNVEITGTTNIEGVTTIQDNFTVVGNTDLQSDVDVHGELTVTGNTNLQGNLYVSGNLEILGSATQVSIQSTALEIDDNIIRLNAYSPFERYAGFEVIDSGSSGVSASLVWDSQNDYWMFVSSSGASSKLIGTTANPYGSEISLSTNSIAKATGKNSIGDSLLSDNGSVLSYNTNVFTVSADSGDVTITGNLSLTSVGGEDRGLKSSSILFRNSENVLGYIRTEETTEVLDGILGYNSSNGLLSFSTVIDGGQY